MGRCCKGQGKDTEKLKRVIQSPMLSLVVQWHSRRTRQVQVCWSSEYLSYWHDDLKRLSALYFSHRPTYQCRSAFGLPISLLLCLIRALWYSGRTARGSLSLKMCQDVSPSLDMPTERHFLKRQCWQRFRFMRMIRQFSFFTHIL